MFVRNDGLVIDDGAQIHQGAAHGDVGLTLNEIHFQPGLLRPYLLGDGKRYVTLNTNKFKFDEKLKRDVPVMKRFSVDDLIARGIGSPVFNAATLTKQAWQHLLDSVVRATRQRLKAWTQLSARSRRTIPNAMGKTTVEYQNMNDPGEAVVDMDGLADGRGDRPLFKLMSAPLPITHSDFYFSQREIMVSRNGGAPLDTTMAEAAGRRVAETIEQTLIGTLTGTTYGTVASGPGAHTGNSTAYGYTNFPYRVTKTDLHTPVTTAPETVVEDVLEMRETMYTNGFYGPFMLYHSTGYDRFFDDDYFRTGGTAVTRTLRERLQSIEGIMAVERLDYLISGYQMVLVQMTSEVVEAIEGMEIQTVQWESQGGMRQNFKVMAIKTPLLKTPYNGVAGMIHGTTS